jgi:arylsulfatase A-like enzyme
MKRTSFLPAWSAAAAALICCAAPPQTQVHLSDLIGSADVKGLVSSAPGDTAVQTMLILDEDFEDISQQWKAITPGTSLSLTSVPQRGRVLSVRSEGRVRGGAGAYRTFPVMPGARYSVSWDVRPERLTKEPATAVRSVLASVMVCELTVGEDSTAVPGLVGRPPEESHPASARYHLGSGSAREGDWLRGQMMFTAGPATCRIAVVLILAVGVERVWGEVLFDRVEVVERRASYASVIAGLKQQYADPSRENSNPHSMLLRGPLASNMYGSERLGPSSYLRDTRTGIFAPAPTTITFPRAKIPAGAQLDVSLAMMRESWAAPGDGVRFLVRILGQRDTTVVLDKYLDARSRQGDRGWLSSRIDLGEWHGQPVRIQLVTLPGESGNSEYDLAVWGDPVLWSPGTPVGDNLVILAVDTMRADRCGVYGCSRELTPRIDRLARGGYLFRNATTQSSWTLPAFASLVTSKAPESHGAGLRKYSGLAYPHDHWGISSSEHTLAEVLRRHGYVTQGYAVSATLYGTGFEQGFDGFVNDLDVEGCVGEVITGRGIQWLRDNRQKRFFLFLHYFDPHQPFNAPAPWNTLFFGRAYPYPEEARRWYYKTFVEMTREGLLEWPDTAFIQMGTDLYDGEVAYADYCLGLVIDELRRIGVYDRSIVVVMSDHGEEFWEHGECGHRTNLYQSIQAVPLIIKPSVHSPLRGRGVVEGRVRLVDVVPTVLELLDVAVPEDLEGRSLVRAMQGTSEPRVPTVFAQTDAHHDGLREVYSVAEGSLKLIVYFSRFRPSFFREELYDLQADPAEKVSIVGERSAEITALREKLACHIARDGWGWHLDFDSGGRPCRFRGDVELDGTIEFVQVAEYWKSHCGVVFSPGRRGFSFDCTSDGSPCYGILFRTSSPLPNVRVRLEQPMNASVQATPDGPAATLEGESGEVVRVWRSGSAAGEVVVGDEERGVLLEKLRALGYVDGY